MSGVRMTATQLADDAHAIAKAGIVAVSLEDRRQMAIGLFLQGYPAGRALHLAFVELEDNDGALQMLARHRVEHSPNG